ncbi:hypothetical protein A4X13_0g2967 [Tilletia indica]|uniref:Uncharacterized protein n=1 Tax=Tilletia indica TaxID=43049 RepID=A0A177TBY5_9BASI|nr:hypothetical protein A4X13_0g2967 [Tilletia indica]
MSAMPAVHRFLAFPELVEHMLSYLSRERVDLLSLSAVSKAFRVYALRVWAKYLDIPTSAAVKRLQFYKANPQVLSQVRFLRIRNDGVELEPEQSSLPPFIPVPNWAAITSLLVLLHRAQMANHRMPAIDLTLAQTDIKPLINAFHRCQRLKQNVVALRIIAALAIRTPEDTVDMDTAYWQVKEQALDARRAVWDEQWDDLGQFVSEIQWSALERTNSGLLIFHYRHDGDKMYKHSWGHSVPPTFWETFAKATASTLQDFSARLALDDEGEFILPLLTFDYLEKFCCMMRDPNTASSLNEFLDRHPHLQELDIGATMSPSFSQTFPDLQSLTIEDSELPLASRKDFARRHPNILATEDCELILDDPDTVASEIYPNLRQLTSPLVEAFEEYAKRGGRLSHIRLKDCDPPEKLDLQAFSSTMWLTRFPEAAKAVTCLELELGFVEDMDRFQASFSSAFTSDFLPNLIELALIWRKNSPFGFPEPIAEEKIGPLLAGLVTARSLRILHLSDQTKPFPKKEILIDCVFPQSLEYLVWLETPAQESQYFRFLDTQPDSSSSSKPTPALGKRGKLQRISAMFRTKITPEGVWERPFHAGRMVAILDHINPQS